MEDLERLKAWNGKKVFVTGGTGVVGTNLVNRLAGLGAEVTALVRDWVPGTRVLGTWLSGESGVNLVRGELEDYQLPGKGHRRVPDRGTSSTSGPRPSSPSGTPRRLAPSGRTSREPGTSSRPQGS